MDDTDIYKFRKADNLNIYNELGLKTIINASDTYTRIGGSRMSERVLAAMTDAARYFVDISELAEKVCAEIARMTGNEAAFISSGCGACMVLASAALMTGGCPEIGDLLPDTSKCPKNEFVILEPQGNIPALPYWRLIGISGAKTIPAKPTPEGLKEAISERCAGVWLFAGTLYEQDLPPLKQLISTAHDLGARVLVDAAAQIPPVSNLWHYTKELGADGAVYSGGKFIMGPQSTGLFVGNADIVRECYALSNPNVGIGRPYKVGKEEYVALYEAVRQLLESDATQVKAGLNAHLDRIERELSECRGILMTRLSEGRLGQDAPRLLIRLPEGKSGQGCARFLLDKCDPAVDIGCFLPDDPSGRDDEVFVNTINLREGEAEYIASCLKWYLNTRL